MGWGAGVDSTGSGAGGGVCDGSGSGDRVGSGLGSCVGGGVGVTVGVGDGSGSGDSEGDGLGVGYGFGFGLHVVLQTGFWPPSPKCSSYPLTCTHVMHEPWGTPTSSHRTVLFPTSAALDRPGSMWMLAEPSRPCLV